MRRCEDATRICVLHLSNNWSGKGKGGEGKGQWKCLGCCSSATRHSKTLASYDNLSYPSVEKYFQIQIQIEMCVSVVDAFVARGPACHKQQQSCYEVYRFVSRIAIPLPLPLPPLGSDKCRLMHLFNNNNCKSFYFAAADATWDWASRPLRHQGSLSPPLALPPSLECVWCVVYRSCAWL